MRSYLFLAAFSLPAIGQVLPVIPPDTSVRLHAGGDHRYLEVNDPGNHAWMLQSSSDLQTWTDGPTHRVFNGVMRIPVPPNGRKQFYRLDPELAQPLPSSTARALRLPATPFNYANPALPQSFVTGSSQIDTQPADNVVTNAGATLGRVLFYDKRLSANQTISCASCHQAEHGFSDPRPLSVGFAGGTTRRNSMGLTNSRFHAGGKFLWDERAASLEIQVLMPIQDPIEMGMTLPQVVQRLSAEPFYGELFTAAFGTAEINSTRISRALAQFIRSIVSANSKWDAGQASNFANFTAQEKLGRELFQDQCAGCHAPPTFAVPIPTRNGLEFPIIDKGVGAITGKSADNGRFKVSTLRNVELTAPYMHDGRIQTLEQVVDFYNLGGKDEAEPDLTLGLTSTFGMGLTQQQKDALVVFMKTLTDTSVINDEKFSDPFRYQAE